jgi:yecA family protein
MPPAGHHRTLALFALGRTQEAEQLLREEHARYPALLDALLPDVLDVPPPDSPYGMVLGGASQAYEHRNETRAAWIASGALAWARGLKFSAPRAPARETGKPATPVKKTQKAQSVQKASALPASPKSATPPASLKKMAPGFGAVQARRLRRSFRDYPRLHGLVTAIAWSPDLVMPNQWLPLAMALHAAAPDPPPSAKDFEADLDALMRLYNHQNLQLLQAPVGGPQPLAAQPHGALKPELAQGDEPLFAWAAGFIQGAELSAGAWRRVGRPLKSGKSGQGSSFGELHALAARANAAGGEWRPTQDSGQALLLGVENEAESPEALLRLALADLWRLILPLRQAGIGRP